MGKLDYRHGDNKGMEQWGNSTTGMGIIKAWKWGKSTTGKMGESDYKHGENISLKSQTRPLSTPPPRTTDNCQFVRNV